MNLLKGNNHALAATYPFIDVDRLSDPLIRDQIDVEAAARGVDRRHEYYRHAFRFVAESPLEALALVPRKLAAFFVPVRFPLGSGTARQNADGEWRIDDYVARPIGRGDGIMALPGILAFFAALVWWRSLTSAGRFIVLVAGLTAIIHVVTFAQTRFRLPYDPLLALLFVQMASSALSSRRA